MKAPKKTAKPLAAKKSNWMPSSSPPARRPPDGLVEKAVAKRKPTK
jgi:hypothetical protein